MLNNHNDLLKGVSVVIKASFYVCFPVSPGGWLATEQTWWPEVSIQAASKRPMSLGGRKRIQSQAGTPSHWLTEEGHPHWAFWNPLVSHEPKDYVFNMSHWAWYQGISCLQLRGAILNEGDDLQVQEITRWEENPSLIYTSWDMAS